LDFCGSSIGKIIETGTCWDMNLFQVTDETKQMMCGFSGRLKQQRNAEGYGKSAAVLYLGQFVLADNQIWSICACR